MHHVRFPEARNPKRGLAPTAVPQWLKPALLSYICTQGRTTSVRLRTDADRCAIHPTRTDRTAYMQMHFSDLLAAVHSHPHWNLMGLVKVALPMRRLRASRRETGNAVHVCELLSRNMAEGVCIVDIAQDGASLRLREVFA